MKFFQHQARARRHTLKLLLLMTLAVTTLVSLSSLGLGLLWRELNQQYGQPKVLNWTVVAVIAVLMLVPPIQVSGCRGDADLQAVGRLMHFLQHDRGA